MNKGGKREREMWVWGVLAEGGFGIGGDRGQGQSLKRLERWHTQLAAEVEARCLEVAWSRNQGQVFMCPQLGFPSNDSTYAYPVLF